MNAELIGIIAGTLIIYGQLDQIVKIIRRKSTNDISLSLYVVLSIAVAMWTIYGAYNDFIVFLMNGILLALTLTVLYLKLRY